MYFLHTVTKKPHKNPIFGRYGKTKQIRIPSKFILKDENYMYNYLFIYFFWVFARGFFFMPKTNPSAEVKERKNLG